MSHVEPLWLHGEKESKQGEARVQRVEHEEARQFVVLPFFENGDVEPGEERYMLWGRPCQTEYCILSPRSGAPCVSVFIPPILKKDPLATDGWFIPPTRFRAMQGRGAWNSMLCSHLSTIGVARHGFASMLRMKSSRQSPCNTRAELRQGPQPCSIRMRASGATSRGFQLRSVDPQPLRWDLEVSKARVLCPQGCAGQLKSSGMVRRSFGSEWLRPPTGTGGTHHTTTSLKTMTRRQAAAGETFEGVEAVYIHGEEAAPEVAKDVRVMEGIREMVAVNLLPRTVWRLIYGGHTFPTIKNIDTLRYEAQFFTLGKQKVNGVQW
jgi:hypothetical protein